MIQELKTCRICNQEVKALSHFYREHGLVLEDYILKFFPKADLFDKTPIIYKTPEQFFSSDFNGRNNLKQYLKNLPKNEAIIYCQELLKKRKEEKDLIYAPFQVELHSLSCFPHVHYLSSLFDYYKFCEEIGLVNKVKQIPSDFVLNLSEPPPDSYIVVDSRENKPLKFDFSIQVEKLDFADYKFSHNPYIVFDRKSLQDWIGTLTQGLDRFSKELERAEKAGIYLIMIVESKFQDALSFNHLPWMKRVKTKATPEFIMHNMRDLLQRFPKFQVLFVNGRQEMASIMKKGFLSGDIFTQYDLQILYLLKKI